MPDTKKVTKDNQDDMKSIDDYLDEALEETFPAGRLVLDKTMVYDKINHVVNKIHQTLIRNSKNFLFRGIMLFR